MAKTFLLVRGAHATCDCETSARSRRAERIRGEEVFDRGELTDALGRHGRGLTEDLSRSGRRCEPRGDVRFLSRLILEAMPRRSVERRDGGMSVPTSARAPFGSRKVQSAAATRRVVAERIWGLWNETRHKPAPVRRFSHRALPAS